MRMMMMISGIAMGGAERNIVSLMPYLLEQGVDLTLGTLETRRDSPLLEDFAKTGVRRLNMDASRLLDYAAWRRFVHTLRREKFELLHAEDQYTNFFAAGAHRRLGIPTVMTRHVMVEPADTRREAVKARLVLAAARYGFNRVITVSEAVRQHFSEQAGIPLARIETIYNGIQLARFETRGGRAAKRTELGWSEDDRVVTMVSVLRRGKGHEVLFQAIPTLKEAVPQVKIKLVGEGELSESLREQAAPYGDVIEFMGQRMDVPELLGASDVLVLPSWSEALPTVLIEAGAASLPVVATDVGGSAEIVQDDETGYIVQPGDADQLAARLLDLLQNPDRARQMGDAAYQRVTRKFSLETQAKETIALYEKVLEN